jgi:hypothetical protein
MLALPRLIQVIYSYAPACCYGSVENVEAWLKKADRDV